VLEISLHFGVIELAADETLGVEDSKCTKSISNVTTNVK